MDLNSLLTKIIYILCNLYIMWPHSTPEHLRYPGGRDGHPRKHQILSMIALSPFITVYGSFARNLFCYMLGGEGWLHAAYCTQVKIHTCFYLVWLLVAWVANWARISDPEYLRHYVARQRWLRRDVMRRQWTNRLRRRKVSREVAMQELLQGQGTVVDIVVHGAVDTKFEPI